MVEKAFGKVVRREKKLYEMGGYPRLLDPMVVPLK
jgi:hypothetical protein